MTHTHTTAGFVIQRPSKNHQVREIAYEEIVGPIAGHRIRIDLSAAARVSASLLARTGKTQPESLEYRPRRILACLEDPMTVASPREMSAKDAAPRPIEVNVLARHAPAKFLEKLAQ